MKTAIIGTGTGASLETIMAIYPRHQAVVDTFVARGDILGIGPFTDRSGNLAIFRSREAAELFVEQDPFVREGVIASYAIREWGDTMLSG